jgi:hypothetical protein
MNTKCKFLTAILLPLLFFFNTTPVSAPWRAGITAGTRLSSLIRDSQLKTNTANIGFLIGANARLNLDYLSWFVKSGDSYSLERD